MYIWRKNPNLTIFLKILIKWIIISYGDVSYCLYVISFLWHIERTYNLYIRAVLLSVISGFSQKLDFFFFAIFEKFLHVFGVILLGFVRISSQLSVDGFHFHLAYVRE